jgi:hypothetical protein
MAITLRGAKGSALTHSELDANFTDLETDINTVQSNVSLVATSNIHNLSNGVVSSSLIPSSNAVFSLGSPTMWFKDLYLANTTLYIDGVAVLQVSEGNLVLTDALQQLSATQKKALFGGGNGLTLAGGALASDSIAQVRYNANATAGTTDFNAGDLIAAPHPHDQYGIGVSNSINIQVGANLKIALGDYIVNSAYTQETKVSVGISSVRTDATGLRPNELDICAQVFGGPIEIIDTVGVSEGSFTYTGVTRWTPNNGNRKDYFVRANASNSGTILVDHTRAMYIAVEDKPPQ